MTDQDTQPTAPTPDPTKEPTRKPDEEPTDSPNVSEAAATADAIGIPETAPVDGAPVDAAGSAPAATEAATSSTTPATTTPAATTPETAPAVVTSSGRRTAVVRATRTLGTILLTVVLFAGGIALGNYLFQTSRPAPVDSVAVGPTTELPAVAQEFVAALAANDADALRSSLDKDPHLDLTREMTKFGIQRVDGVEILGTHVDGARSATEILMQYESTDGTPFAINLVILVDGGKIEGFR